VGGAHYCFNSVYTGVMPKSPFISDPVSGSAAKSVSIESFEQAPVHFPNQVSVQVPADSQSQTENQSKDQALSILRDTFGYDGFRSPQADIIDLVSQGGDA